MSADKYWAALLPLNAREELKTQEKQMKFTINSC